MPQIFSIGSYVVYFWSDEGEPKEPVHVHTKSMHCIVAHNKSKIPMHILNDIMSVIEVRAMYICSEWKKHFEEISYYCQEFYIANCDSNLPLIKAGVAGGV